MSPPDGYRDGGRMAENLKLTSGGGGDVAIYLSTPNL